MDIPSERRLGRIKIGEALEDTAAAIGTDPSTLSRIERGKLRRPVLEKRLDEYLRQRHRDLQQKATIAAAG